MLRPLDRRVPTKVENFAQEANFISTFKHPNLIKLLGVCAEGITLIFRALRWIFDCHKLGVRPIRAWKSSHLAHYDTACFVSPNFVVGLVELYLYFVFQTVVNITLPVPWTVCYLNIWTGAICGLSYGAMARTSFYNRAGISFTFEFPWVELKMVKKYSSSISSNQHFRQVWIDQSTLGQVYWGADYDDR